MKRASGSEENGSGMCVSREINDFINNLAAGVACLSFSRRGYQVLNSYYVGGEWKPCCRRQDEERWGTRVEGVRNEERRV